MRSLIVNADDFGLHQDINTGIIAGYQTGCIRSTTLIAGGDAFGHAVSLYEKNRQLGVGVHLTLVGGIKPLSPLSEVASLITAEGRFVDNYLQFTARLFQQQVRLSEVEKELRRQIEQVITAGISITHLDSHQHMHVLPGIIDITLALAKEYRVPAIRIPDEPYLFTGGYPLTVMRAVGRAGLTFFARRARIKARNARICVPDHFFGMLAGGGLTAQYLQAIVAQLPDGVSEVMMHPASDNVQLQQTYGWQYRWTEELAAAQAEDVQHVLTQRQVKICSFGELTHG